MFSWLMVYFIPVMITTLTTTESVLQCSEQL